MKIYGFDAGYLEDTMCMTVSTIHGSFKAPCPHDVYYTLDGFEHLEIQANKEETW